MVNLLYHLTILESPVHTVQGCYYAANDSNQALDRVMYKRGLRASRKTYWRTWWKRFVLAGHG